MHFIEKYVLKNRGAVGQEADSKAEGTLLIAEQAVAEFYDNQCAYGEDLVKIFPAFLCGQRCWLKRETWIPSYGYSASGIQESIVEFEDGIKLFISRGYYDFVQKT